MKLGKRKSTQSTVFIALLFWITLFIFVLLNYPKELFVVFAFSFSGFCIWQWAGRVADDINKRKEKENNNG